MIANHHWNRLRIRRFRGLRTLDLHDLAAFNVFVGPNDVGKTSVLEAIFLLSGSGNINLPIRVQNFRDYIVPDIDGLSSFFHRLETTRGIELSADVLDPRQHRKLSISAPREDTTVDIAPLPTRTATSIQSSSSIPSNNRVLRYDVTIENAHDEQSPLSFSGKLVDQGKNFSVEMTPSLPSGSIIPATFLHAGFNYDSTSIGDVIVNKKDAALLKYLQIINPRIERISADGQLAYLDIGLDKMLPMNMFGSGMVRACSIMSLCMGDQRILLVDEIERGLHYAAVPPLLKALLILSRSSGMQIYVTTHSISILQGLQEVLQQDDMSDYRDTTACHALQRNGDSVVRAYTYAYAEFDHCIRSGIEIR